MNKHHSINKRTLIGVGASLAWIVFILALVLQKQSSIENMTLNEWGDFFAGAFAPLAFLWLVLGYLQQGDELRLSTDALRMQAQELGHSVAQQRELVEVTRNQMEVERLARQEELELRNQAALPRFKITPGHIENLRQSFDLMNTGASVSDLNIFLIRDQTEGLALSLGDSLATGQAFPVLFTLDLRAESSAQIEIRYRSNLGTDGVVRFYGECKNEREGYTWTQKDSLLRAI